MNVKVNHQEMAKLDFKLRYPEILAVARHSLDLLSYTQSK